MLSLLAPLALLLSPALAALDRRTLTLRNAVVSPDGFERTAIVANDEVNGPLLWATKGDQLHVNVVNRMNDPTMRRSTSIHWHGLLQKRTNHYDGPAFVSQCPIPPALSFEYKLNLDEGGTYWYHSHLSSQYLDGLRGPLVIVDPQDPHRQLYDVDDPSTVITLTDWWHDKAPHATEIYLSPNNTAGTESVPDSGLINNRGRYVGGPATPWSVIPVTQGSKYRFRIVNMAGIARFRFAIQGHKLTVIEADGMSHQPLEVDYVDIFPGQRYSVVVHANQEVGNYWIRAPMSIRSANTNPLLDVNNVNAILRYAGAPEADPTGTQDAPTGVALVEASMIPVHNPGVTGSQVADKTFNLTFTRQTDADGLKFLINGQHYVPPKLPTLLKVLTGASQDSDFQPSENTFVINQGDTVEMAISGAPGHPFHLHGHSFDVVQSATGARNYVNPPRRDVVATAGANPVVIRFKADNPGPWILHCHIDLHFEAGLAAVFAESPQATRFGNQSVRPGLDWWLLCPAYNLLPKEFQ